MAHNWLQQAMDLAGTAKSRHKHAALVVRDGAVVSSGVARRTGHDPSMSENSWRCSYMHAEFAALSAARGGARGAVLYVARVNKSGAPMPSEPCVRCRGLAQRMGVARVVWTEQ